MNFKSKKIPLVILGLTAIICSRALFFFFNHPEGPNLLIVAVLAIAIFLLSVAAYAFVASKMQGLTKISVIIGLQILAVAGLYFCMR